MRLRVLIVSTLLVVFVSPSALAAADDPNDPYYSYQSALYSDRVVTGPVARAWTVTHDASSVIVAVIDTGAELDHPDLEDNLWTNDGEIPGNGIDDDGNGYVDDVHGYDFRNRDGEPEDGWGHGTLSAGIIGAVGNNDIGTVGVAWRTQLMILKVFGDSGGGRLSDFADAVRYAARNGARVINAGWIIPPSYPGDQIPLLSQAILEAREAGVLVVAAAGNDGENLDESPVFPAGYAFDHVLSVGALKDGEASLLEESNYGVSSVAVATVGEDVLGPYLKHSYATLTGTSSATAMTTGIAALMLEEDPDLTPQAIRERMIQTSVSNGSLNGLITSGGALEPYAAMTASLDLDSEGGGVASSGGRATASIPQLSAASGGCSLIPSL